MTKYILHGGLLSREVESDRTFFKEITKDLCDGDKVLFIGFAREDGEERITTYERDKAWILASTGKEIIVKNAENENLSEQVKKAKAVFVTGGDTQELHKELAKCSNFFDLLEGKVYAGSSAGALVLATKYFGGGKNEFFDGMGVFPFSLMVHYGAIEKFNGSDENLDLLREKSGDAEVIALKENEWIVRGKDSALQKKRKALLVPINSEKKILIQDRRGHKPPDWGFWGGGIEEGETALEAVIRETSEELNIDLTEKDLLAMGDNHTIFDGVRVERTFFLYKTDQKEFEVSEGAGAYWMTFDEAREKLEIGDRFDEIVDMVSNALK